MQAAAQSQDCRRTRKRFYHPPSFDPGNKVFGKKSLPHGILQHSSSFGKTDQHYLLYRDDCPDDEAIIVCHCLSLLAMDDDTAVGDDQRTREK
jgi:hypothetical protein